MTASGDSPDRIVLRKGACVGTRCLTRLARDAH
jgi:hypothetical protein